MINKAIGFAWGVLVTSMFTTTAPLWVWIVLVIVLTLLTVAASVYMFVTDYMGMAETGWSIGKWIIGKVWKKKENQ